MDWLSKYNTTIICKGKKVIFQGSKWHVVSVLKARKMLAKGCMEYFANIVDTKKKVKTELFDVHVVCKFLNVFPEDLSRLPIDREIEFKIELLLGIA